MRNRENRKKEECGWMRKRRKEERGRGR